MDVPEFIRLAEKAFGECGCKGEWVVDFEFFDSCCCAHTPNTMSVSTSGSVEIQDEIVPLDLGRSSSLRLCHHRSAEL